jgi:lysozyme
MTTEYNLTHAQYDTLVNANKRIKELLAQAHRTFDGLTIDVSQWQGVIDWRRVRAAGVEQAIIRATMGVGGVDPRLASNANGAAAAGVATGYYHLLRPEYPGAEQAAWFLQQVGDLPFGTFLAVDVELDNQQTPEQVADCLLAFVQAFEQAEGIKPFVYTAAWFFDPKVAPTHDAVFRQCPLWVAEYGDQLTRIPRAWKPDHWRLWQYTSSGSVDGIEGRVDLNRWREEELLVWSLPVDTPARVTQPFGVNTTGIEDFYTRHGLPSHEGSDFGGSDGANIYAVADGVVKLIAKDNGVHPYGNHIRITHADGYESIYAHLRGFVTELQQGDSVRREQVIGYMGSTGNSTGTHLHLSIKHNGVIIDPAPLFTIQLAA